MTMTIINALLTKIHAKKPVSNFANFEIRKLIQIFQITRKNLFSKALPREVTIS
jgi:hypothetical protein